MKYQNRADLLIAAGNSIKLQESAGIISPLCKFSGRITPLEGRSFDEPREYELPIAVIEGKPVFVGDEWHDCFGRKYVISDVHRGLNLHPELSWLTPKPSTVMVELLREDAEYLAKTAQDRLTGTYAIDRAGVACRKAMEK
jgi:hypothetical protein